MKTFGQRRKRLPAIAAALGGVVAAAGLVVSAGIGNADPVELTVNYTCPFPLIGSQPVKIVISSDIPSTIAVGEATPEFAVTAVSTVGDTVTQGLTLVGAKTVEGTAQAAATVEVPEGTLPVTVPATIPSTPVPASGGFDVTATGSAPALTFSQAGQGTIRVGDISLTLTPRTADGSETGLGTFTAQCTQDAGQNNVLATFQITEGGGDTTTSTPTSSPTSTGTTTTTTTSSSSGTTTSKPTSSSSTSTSTTSSSTTTSSSGGAGAPPVTSGPGAGGAGAPAANPQATGEYGQLAYTGPSIVTPLCIGVALVAAGTALLLLRRRRTD